MTRSLNNAKTVNSFIEGRIRHREDPVTVSVVAESQCERCSHGQDVTNTLYGHNDARTLWRILDLASQSPNQDIDGSVA